MLKSTEVTHVFADVCVVLDLLMGTSNDKDLQNLNRVLTHNLRHPDGTKFQIHISIHVLAVTATQLVEKFHWTTDNAMAAVGRLLMNVKDHGGIVDTTYEFGTPEGRSFLAAEAKRNDNYDKFNKLDVEDEGLLRSLARLEGVLGHQITLITCDEFCRNQQIRLGGKAVLVNETNHWRR